MARLCFPWPLFSKVIWLTYDYFLLYVLFKAIWPHVFIAFKCSTFLYLDFCFLCLIFCYSMAIFSWSLRHVWPFPILMVPCPLPCGYFLCFIIFLSLPNNSFWVHFISAKFSSGPINSPASISYSLSLKPTSFSWSLIFPSWIKYFPASYF